MAATLERLPPGRGFLIALLVVALTLWVGSMIDAWRVAKSSAARRTATWIVVLCGVGFFVVSRATNLLMRTFVLEAFEIPASSMAPTLLVGDHIFVDARS